MVVEVPNPTPKPTAASADPKIDEERTRDAEAEKDTIARDDDGIPDHPAASPELFAAFAALWALTQDVTLAGTDAATPPPLWPMALHAGVSDPLGDADEADVATLDAATLIPVAVALLRCGMRRLALKAAVVIRRLLQGADEGVKGTDEPAQIAVSEGFVHSATAILNAVPPADATAFHLELLQGLGFAVTNITAVAVASHDVAAAAARFLDPANALNEPILQAALSLIGRMSAEGANIRDHCHKIDGLAAHVAILLDDATRPVETTVEAASTIAMLCRGKPFRATHRVTSLLPSVVRAVSHVNSHVAAHASWALSYITDINDATRDAFIAIEGGITRVFAAMQRDDDILTPSLRTIGNLCSGTAAHTRAAMEQGLMQAMPFLLQHAKRNVVKEAAWTLSNVLADDSKYIGLMLHVGVFPHVLRLLQSPHFEVRKEASWCVANGACDATDVDVQGMLAAGVIPALAGSLTGATDDKCITVQLEAIEYLMHTVEDDVKAAMEADPAMLPALEELQNHLSEAVYTKAVAILERLGALEGGQHNHGGGGGDSDDEEEGRDGGDGSGGPAGANFGKAAAGFGQPPPASLHGGGFTF